MFLVHQSDDSDGDDGGSKDDGSRADAAAVPIEYDAEGNPIPRKKIAGSSCHQCKTRREGDELIYCGMSHAKKGRAKKRRAERKASKRSTQSTRNAAVM